jgi:hypothetical protein
MGVDCATSLSFGQDALLSCVAIGSSPRPGFATRATCPSLICIGSFHEISIARLLKSPGTGHIVPNHQRTVRSTKAVKQHCDSHRCTLGTAPGLHAGEPDLRLRNAAEVRHVKRIVQFSLNCSSLDYSLSRHKRKDALKELMNTGLSENSFPFGAPITG